MISLTALTAHNTYLAAIPILAHLANLDDLTCVSSCYVHILLRFYCLVLIPFKRCVPVSQGFPVLLCILEVTVGLYGLAMRVVFMLLWLHIGSSRR